MFRLIISFSLVYFMAVPLHAAIASKAVTETVEIVMKKFGKEAAQEGAESLAKKATVLATKYGDEGLIAFQKCGPVAIRCVEEAGEQAAPDLIRLMAKRGDAAIWVVSKPNRTAIFLKHGGDDAASAMIKHKGIVEPLLEQFGKPAAAAFNSVSTQNGRLLVRLSQDGELTKIGRTPELLEVIGKYGDAGMDFIWRNKVALATGAVLLTFLADPEPYISGTLELTDTVIGTAGETIVGPIVDKTNWTLVILIIIVIGIAWFILQRRKRHLRQ